MGLAISTAVVLSKNDQLAEGNRNLIAANQREKAAKDEARGDRKLALEAIQDIVFKVDPALRNQSGFAETRRSILEKLPAIVQRIGSRSGAEDDTTRTELYTLLAVADITEQLAASEQATDTDWAERATNLRKRAREIAEARLAATPEEPDAIRDGMVTLNSIAKTAMQEGDLQQAKQLYEKSLTTAESLFELEQLDETQRRRDLALACERCGVVSEKLGNFTAALEFFKRQHKTLVPLGQGLSAADVVNRDIAISLGQIGRMQLRNRQIADCLKTLQQSVTLRNARAAALPNDFQAQRDVADGSLTLAQLLMATNQLNSAKPLFEKAASTLETLTQMNPANLELRRSHATALQNLGDLARRSRQPKEGLKSYERAIAQWKELRTLDPDQAETHRKLIATRINFSDLLSDMQRLDDAILQLTEAHEDCLQRMKVDANVSLLRSQTLSSNKLGKIYLLKDDFTTADAWFRKGLAQSRERAKKLPDDYEAQRDLAIALNNFGDVLLEKNAREALEYYGEAKSQIEARVSAENPESVQDMLTSLSRMGSAFGVLKEHEAAQESLREGLSLLTELRQKKDAPHLIVMAAKLHRQSGLVYLSSAEPTLAETAFVEASELLERNRKSGQLTNADSSLLQRLNAEIAAARAQQKALGPWDELLKEPEAARVQLFEQRAMAMLQRGQYQDALDAGSRLFELPKLGKIQLYNAACVFSRCAAHLQGGGSLKSGDGSQVTIESLQERALEALRLSIAAGWTDLEHMKSDTDLASLKSLPEFQKILSGEDAQSPEAAGEETARPRK